MNNLDRLGKDGTTAREHLMDAMEEAEDSGSKRIAALILRALTIVEETEDEPKPL